MKRVTLALAAAFLGSIPYRLNAQSVEQWQDAIQSARWTGPLLASNAETLPAGHFYTEPYFFDVISGGDHNPGSSGFYQYGLLDNVTVGVQPFFSLGTRKYNRGAAIGDFKLLSQVRLSHFTPKHRVPSVSLVTNLVLPTGQDDHLGALKEGHGNGSFAPEIGLNVQQYFLLGNGRLLRARFNILKDFPISHDVSGRSVFGTSAGFHGRAKPGSKTSLIAGMEYSLTKEWVLAFDVERDQWGRTKVVGHDASGAPVKHISRKSWNVGFAPAVEYNWSDRAGIIAGVWIVARGHNSRSSVTPAIAIQRFW
jgi:hypothetical protein